MKTLTSGEKVDEEVKREKWRKQPTTDDSSSRGWKRPEASSDQDKVK